MRATDELNNLTTEYVKYDIDTYFDAMDITEEQKGERKEAASDLWWVLLLLFALIQSSIEDGDLDYAMIHDTFVDSYTEVVEKYALLDNYINQYIPIFTQNVLNTTWDNLDFADPDSYWTSSERALGIAVNEANTILNYEDLRRAIEAGMNVKIWKTENDSKVRETHRKLEGVKVGINEYFKVGTELLLFPRDEVNCNNIREIANCRCYAKAEYDSKYDTPQDTVVEKGYKYVTMNSEGVAERNYFFPYTLSFFAGENLSNQGEFQLRKGIRNLEKEIEKHKSYISNPKQKWKDWDDFSEERKERELRHWQTEIDAFNQSIINRKDELISRGIQP